MQLVWVGHTSSSDTIDSSTSVVFGKGINPADSAALCVGGQRTPSTRLRFLGTQLTLTLSSAFESLFFDLAQMRV